MTDAAVLRQDRRWPGSRSSSTLWRLVAAVLAWLAAVIAGSMLDLSPTVHRVALFGHLCSLVLGLGAVLMVDWIGLLWILRQRALADVLRTVHGASLPIWAGLIGLLISGALLEPRVTPLTALKFGAVLVVALNGVYARTLYQRMAVTMAEPLRWPMMLRSFGCAVVSQAAWWMATVIGFLNTQS